MKILLIAWACLFVVSLVASKIVNARTSKRLKAAGLDVPEGAPISDDQIHALIRGNEKIAAIKLHRRKYGTGLTEAKAAVEKMEAEMAAQK